MKRLAIVALLFTTACQTTTTVGVGAGGSGGGVAVSASTSSGGSFVSRYGPRVNQVNNAIFEVIPHAGVMTDDYWCAAADYARRRLGADWSDQVYVASSYTTSVTTGRRSAVQFTLDPAGAGITPIDVSFRSGFKVGDSMSVNQADSRCQIFRPFVF